MDSQTTADEIRGLITLGLLDEARAVVDRSDLDDPRILEVARRFYVAAEDWEKAAQAGLHLLDFPEQRTWQTAHNTALALHQVGKTAFAAGLLSHYPPDDSAYERSFHFYALACYLGKLGRYRNALRALHTSLEADRHYCPKAFVDHDLRALWQWLGDLKSSDEELSAILGDSLWNEVLYGVESTAEFTLDPSDLELHPKLRSLVRFHPSRAVYLPRHDIGHRGRRVLHEWLLGRSRWAIRRLRKAISRVRHAGARTHTTGRRSNHIASTCSNSEDGKFQSKLTMNHTKKMKRQKSKETSPLAELATPDTVSNSEASKIILDHVEESALSKKPELAAKQQRLLNILRQQQQD